MRFVQCSFATLHVFLCCTPKNNHPTQSFYLGRDNVETQPVEESVIEDAKYQAILRARTLELGEEVVDDEVDVPPVNLSRGKSTIQLSQEKLQEPAESQVETGSGGGAGGSPEKPKSELPDAPMVTRGDQKHLKELRELGVKKPPRKRKEGKDDKKDKKGKEAVAKKPAAKRTQNAVLKRPAGKTPQSRKPKAVAPSEEKSDSKSVVENTQHYSPKSPLKPKNLEAVFEGAAEEPKAKESKSNSKATTEDVTPEKKRRKSEKEVDPTQLPSRGTGEQRVSFAGRYCPKGDQAKLRFQIMVATFKAEICPSISGNPSSVEVRCPKKGWSVSLFAKGSLFLFVFLQLISVVLLSRYTCHVSHPNPVQLLWWNFAFKDVSSAPAPTTEGYQKIASAKAIVFMESSDFQKFRKWVLKRWGFLIPAHDFSLAEGG